MAPMSRLPRVLCCVLLCLAGLSSRAWAGPWEEANAAFVSGDYNKALPLYEEELAREGSSAARLYNMGNTLAKLSRNGEAVLCYERAALLAPRDADIQANLKLARPLTAATLTESPPLWKAPLYWLSLHEWSWITALGLGLAAVPVAAWLFLTKRPAWLREATPVSIGGGIVLAVLGSLALLDRGSEARLAILTAKEPVLRLSPFAKAEPVNAAPSAAGTRVIPAERHGEWVYVRLAGNESVAGWVPGGEVEKIVGGD